MSEDKDTRILELEACIGRIQESNRHYCARSYDAEKERDTLREQLSKEQKAFFLLAQIAGNLRQHLSEAEESSNMHYANSTHFRKANSTLKRELAEANGKLADITKAHANLVWENATLKANLQTPSAPTVVKSSWQALSTDNHTKSLSKMGNQQDYQLGDMFSGWSVVGYIRRDYWSDGTVKVNLEEVK